MLADQPVTMLAAVDENADPRTFGPLLEALYSHIRVKLCREMTLQ